MKPGVAMQEKDRIWPLCRHKRIGLSLCYKYALYILSCLCSLRNESINTSPTCIIVSRRKSSP